MKHPTEAELTYREALISGSSDLGLDLGASLADSMWVHQRLVSRWAGRMNLTAVKDPAESAVKHGLDCLLIAQLLPQDREARVLDVGSGAGFPGLIVALARPRLRMTLMEPLRKRASFLRVARAELGRPDIEIVETRLDTAEATLFDAVISRATLPPLELVAQATPFVGPGGRLIVTSGRGVPAIDRLSDATDLRHIRRLEQELPGGDLRVLDIFEQWTT